MLFYCLIGITLKNKTSKRHFATSCPDNLEGKSTYVNPADGNNNTNTTQYEKEEILNVIRR